VGARILWPRWGDLYIAGQVVEESHSIQIAECSRLAFNKVEPHTARAVVELIGERQDSNDRIDHQLATDGKPYEDVGCAMRVTGSSKCLFQPRGCNPLRREIDAAAHAVLGYI
jgi:hypothetical protein